jgi:DNA mismatch repair protein MutS2
MEFDEATGRPNYRLHAGLAGRSRALSVARERGIPEPVVDRALVLLGQTWQRRERAETEAEKALERLREAERELARERESARREAERLEGERRKIAEDRARMLSEGLAGFERARKELSRRVETELAAIRSENARLAQVSAARLIEEAERAAESEEVLMEAREAEEQRSREVSVGGQARVRGLGAEGTVVSLDGDSAQLDVRGKRLRIRRVDLEPAEPNGRAKATGRSRGIVTAPEREAASDSTHEVNVIGQHLDEAIDAVERALDQALLEGAPHLRIVHGHGTGRLRQGLREHFREHRSVQTLRAAGAREGGNGATILELR